MTKTSHIICCCCQGDRVVLRVTKLSWMFWVFVFLAPAALDWFHFLQQAESRVGQNQQTWPRGLCGNVSSLWVARLYGLNVRPPQRNFSHGEVLWLKLAPFTLSTPPSQFLLLYSAGCFFLQFPNVSLSHVVALILSSFLSGALQAPQTPPTRSGSVRLHLRAAQQQGTNSNRKTLFSCCLPRVRKNCI